MTAIEVKEAIKFLKPYDPYVEENYNKRLRQGKKWSKKFADDFLSDEVAYWKRNDGLPKHYAPEPID